MIRKTRRNVNLEEESGLEKDVMGREIVVSFSPGKPVKLEVGDRVQVKAGEIVLIDKHTEYVSREVSSRDSSNGVLETYRYEGQVIVCQRRVLNSGVIHSFEALTSPIERYYPGKKGYDDLHEVLKRVGMRPIKE